MAQFYVSKSDNKVFRPAKELKGFQKVFLKAGESKQVTIKLDDKVFRYFNVNTDKFEVEGGEWNILRSVPSRFTAIITGWIKSRAAW